ncbi:MAG: DegT/DnrJ/EryC1/StrS family aminotransferase [Clostridiaceae bacterium]|jgi:dTDP-4-amino-4,6-dideoxygalactose transaminase|nr:DegT/DnrJ/EryC1/StrS family aminotransferase [Clostridiaceae bacterium]
MNIQMLDLKAQYASIRDEVHQAVDEVLESQHFMLGPKVTKLEEEIAAYSNCRYALGVSSGTDAILLALMALGVGHGDTVITTTFTFFATAGCIARLGARPLFVDIDPVTFNMSADGLEQLLSGLSEDELSQVKAVVPVHLFGQMADMGRIVPLCKKYGLTIIEDAAQAIGSECPYEGTAHRAGSLGDIGCFSFFPSKNLGGIGDGGMVVTNDPSLFEKMKLLRAHGSSPKYYHKVVGGNFRLDEIQAAVLSVKLKYLDSWTERRQKNAEAYGQLLGGISEESLITPKALPGYRHIYNQYCIRTGKRDELKAYLAENGVSTEIYYPLPMHLQECFAYLGYLAGQFPEAEKASTEVLALPVYPEMDREALKYVAELIRRFY